MHSETSVPCNSSRLVGFYLGEAQDSEGRWIEEIWGWDSERLEIVHDYIQWLFPLRSRSAFNSDAPLLSDDDIATFRTNGELHQRVRKSLALLLRFYGLEETTTAGGALSICIGPRFDYRRKNWLRPHNHNHLRLTRILGSLSLLGLGDEATALQTCLLDIARTYLEAVSDKTTIFWERALL